MTKLLPLFFFITTISFAQNKYSEVITVDSATADQLYSKAKIFVATTFKNPKYATQLNDDAGKNVIVRGRFDVQPHGLPVYESAVSFSLTIAAKEGRYKYAFDEVIYNYQAGSSTRKVNSALSNEELKGSLTKKQWERVKKQADEIITAMITDLKKQMSKNNDW